jgi:creatinine amidohydrolase
MTKNHPRLCTADEKTFWPWRSWTDFAGLPDKKNMCVVVPLCGFADWGSGLPLDAEEVVLMPVLAAAASRSDATQLLVTPPLRFVAGADPGCAFALDVPTAHAFIEEVCVSIAAAGFRRIVLFNSSPWNEDLIDVAARDLRIERGLQMFCINLSALELDFHPMRSRSRDEVNTLVAGLANPYEPSASAAAILSRASGRLTDLLREIIARPPLPRDGALANLTAP